MFLISFYSFHETILFPNERERRREREGSREREKVLWGGRRRVDLKSEILSRLCFSNTDALKRSCSSWILIQSINKWIMQLVDIQLTGFTMHVELTGSACICMTVMCLNEYAIKGHAVEWWIRFVWGRESCLPAAESATDKALVWIGRRNKSSTMQHPKWHSLCCRSIVLSRWAWTEINKSQILLGRKMSNWIWIEIYQSITGQRGCSSTRWKPLSIT